MNERRAPPAVSVSRELGLYLSAIVKLPVAFGALLFGSSGFVTGKMRLLNKGILDDAKEGVFCLESYGGCNEILGTADVQA